MSEAPYTIVLPVRNGGGYLRACVESVLAQELDAFRLLVLDNCSSDGSLEWLTSIEDPRLEIFPSDVPLSIEENWGRILDLPLGEFVTIVSHDDLFDPHYLDVIQRTIERYPDAGLYMTHFRVIDSDGNVVRPCRPMASRETAPEFLSARLRGKRDSFGTGYLVRSDVYRRVGGIPRFENLLFADDALWLSCMRESWKATASESCFSYRQHASSASATSDWRAWLAAGESYSVFLAGLGAHDAAVQRVLDADAAGAFGRLARDVYVGAHMSAFTGGDAVSPDLRRRLLAMLERVAPAAIHTFQAAPSVRGAELASRSALGRTAFVRSRAVRRVLGRALSLS